MQVYEYLSNCNSNLAEPLCNKQTNFTFPIPIFRYDFFKNLFNVSITLARSITLVIVNLLMQIAELFRKTRLYNNRTTERLPEIMNSIIIGTSVMTDLIILNIFQQVYQWCSPRHDAGSFPFSCLNVASIIQKF